MTNHERVTQFMVERLGWSPSGDVVDAIVAYAIEHASAEAERDAARLEAIWT